jgi:hypothetical protein
MEKVSKKQGKEARAFFKKNHPDWLVGGGKSEHVALDYRISFDSPQTEEWLVLNNVDEKYLTEIKIADKNVDDILLSSPFFANNQHFKPKDIGNSKWGEMRRALLAKDLTKGKIVCFIPELKQFIEKQLRLFFAANNFGTRQSKGFGSFTVEKINSNTLHGTDKDFIRNHIHEASGIIAVYIYDKKSTLKKNLERVANTWKYLKAGNSFGEYSKSSLMKYFCKAYNIRWEKRTIKKAIKSKAGVVWSNLRYNQKNRNENFISGCRNDELDEQFLYIRALMGLAEHNEYGTLNGRDSVKVLIGDKLANNQETKYLAIDRFKSPITFKIIDDAIFMFVHPIPPLLSKDERGNDREFEFVLSGKIGETPIQQKILTTLKVPQITSLESFLDALWLDNDFRPNAEKESNAEYEYFKKIQKPSET